jgi:glycosyltransferase involved in cell wall biosynthesis
MENTRISVVMATFNGETYISEQISSILAQLGPNDELLISDDNSTDSTLQIIRSFSDPRIRTLTNGQNRGYTKNFERALEEAKGAYIFLADQDDVWLDGRISKTLRGLEEADFVLCDCITTDSSLQPLVMSRFDQFNMLPGLLRTFVKCRYLGCCMAFTDAVLKKALPFPHRADLVEHDVWLATVANAFFKVSFLKEPLILYRRHKQNTSNGGFTAGYSVFNKIARRIYRFYWLITRSLRNEAPQVRTV